MPPRSPATPATLGYVHTSSKGKQTTVWYDGEERWTGQPGGGPRMILPFLPSRTHGRYYAADIARMDRRAYRRLHDDYMLKTPQVHLDRDWSMRPRNVGPRSNFWRALKAVLTHSVKEN